MKNSKNIFTPTKDMWYIYFNFYTNNQNDINNFKKELKSNYSFIIGFKEKDILFNSKQLLVYVTSKDETEKLKNENTLKLYQKYVGNGGYQSE